MRSSNFQQVPPKMSMMELMNSSSEDTPTILTCRSRSDSSTKNTSIGTGSHDGNSSHGGSTGSSTSNERSGIGKKRARTSSERGKAFRAKQKAFVDDLISSVEHLRQEVHALQYQRSQLACLQERVLCFGYGFGARVIQEYFKIFQFGFSRLQEDLKEQEKKKAFVYNIMSNQVEVNGQKGIDQILDQWAICTECHSFFQCNLVHIQSIETHDVTLVTIQVEIIACLSRLTFEKMFPAILWIEPLVQKLIGKKVNYQGQIIFAFNEQGQIESIQVDMDFIPGLMRVLNNNLDEVCTLMRRSTIQEQFAMGPFTSLFTLSSLKDTTNNKNSDDKNNIMSDYKNKNTSPPHPHHDRITSPTISTTTTTTTTTTSTTTTTITSTSSTTLRTWSSLDEFDREFEEAKIRSQQLEYIE
jgi:hypothetical protein